MIKKYGRKYIGKIYRTHEGYDLKVIDGGNRGGYVTVKIRGYVFEAKICHVQIGNVKYPFHQSVFNVGCFGVGKYSRKNDKLVYNRWVHMLERCYSPEYQKKYPTYIGCSIDKRWHNFQVFAKWHYKYYPTNGLKYELDKDIRIESNKIYSKYTCMFVPRKVNAFMANVKSNNTSGYLGVNWNKSSSSWRVMIHIDGKQEYLGVFKCIKTASRVYQEARQEQAEKWKRYYSFDYPKSILDNLK